MPKDEWGVKRVCPSCSERFYDLQKDPMLCPYCAAEFTLESLMSDKPKIEKAAAAAPKEDAADAVVDDADVVLDDADDDTDIDVDDDLLDDDDDDDVSLEEIADVPADDDDS